MSMYSVNERDGKTVVVLNEALEVHNVDAFQAEMQQLIEQKPPRLVLDCAKVDFISSLGLAVLIRMQTRLKKKGGDLRLAALQKPVAELMRFTRLDQVLEVHKTVDAAVGSFK